MIIRKMFILSKLKSQVLILLLVIVSFAASGQGYNIKVQVEGLKDTTLILGHYFNKSLYPDDTVHVKKDGIGIFKGKIELPQGMYVLVLPSYKTLDIIMGADQVFEITLDTSALLAKLKVKGSIDNEIFSDFQNYMVIKRGELEQQQIAYKAAANDEEKGKIKKKLDTLNKERNDKINKIVSENPDLFVSTFLKATQEIQVPDTLLDKNGNPDQVRQYWYFRNHFFDNFDPSDPRLLRTPLYEDKLMYFIEKVLPQIPDTLNKEIDKIIDNSKRDSSLYRFVLVTLFNHYGKSNIMGMDAVQVHIAEKYYITESWWSDEKFIAELKDRVKILKPLLLGSIAPDIELRFVPAEHFKAAANDEGLKKYPHAGSFFNLHQVEADFIVLIFWEANCGHCKKEVPALHKIYTDTLESEGVKIIAVSTLFGEDGKEQWVDFVNKNNLYDWINAWNPYDYQFKLTYDVKSTPQIFILNKDKEIIGKRIGAENVKELIDAYKKQFPNK